MRGLILITLDPAGDQPAQALEFAAVPLRLSRQDRIVFGVAKVRAPAADKNACAVTIHWDGLTIILGMRPRDNRPGTFEA
jgi:hypothetical protein